MLGSNPIITCTFNGAQSETPSSVEVVINGTFAGLADGTRRYTLPKDDYVELEEFFAEANFRTRVTL
jgi:archaellum component FlaF (FlaF/FlaG flagellin family)